MAKRKNKTLKIKIQRGDAEPRPVMVIPYKPQTFVMVVQVGKRGKVTVLDSGVVLHYTYGTSPTAPEGVVVYQSETKSAKEYRLEQVKNEKEFGILCKDEKRKLRKSKRGASHAKVRSKKDGNKAVSR